MTEKWVSHKKYAKISLQKRQKLIEMVMSLKKSIVQSARQLKVKLSTAKLILKKFKETGSFFEKKMPNYCRRKKREIENHQNTKDLVKLEQPSNEVSLQKFCGDNQQNQQCKQMREMKNCKQEQVMPTMPTMPTMFYLFYYL